MKTEVLSTTYEGNWAAYQKNAAQMSLEKKIDYMEELDLLITGFEGAKKARWLWLFWAIIGVPIFVAMLLLPSQTRGAMAMAMLTTVVLSAVLVLLLLITRRSFVVYKPNLLYCMLGTAVLSFSAINHPVYSGRQVTELGMVIWLAGMVAVGGYISMAGRGFGELISLAKAEQTAVDQSIGLDIFKHTLEPVALRCRVSLEAGETAYLEKAAVLIDVKNKNQYQQLFYTAGNSLVNRLRQGITSVFGKKHPLESQLNMAWEGFLAAGAKQLERATAAPKKNTGKEIEDIGSLIITDRRVLFVTKVSGFQIKLTDLTTYFAQATPVKTIVLESRSGVRTLRADASRYMAMLLDRLC